MFQSTHPVRGATLANADKISVFAKIAQCTGRTLFLQNCVNKPFCDARIHVSLRFAKIALGILANQIIRTQSGLYPGFAPICSNLFPKL